VAAGQCPPSGGHWQPLPDPLPRGPELGRSRPDGAGGPGWASKLPEALGKGEVAVLGPVALADVEAQARRVKIAPRQRGPFLTAQTARGKGGEPGPATGQPPAGEAGPHCRGAGDDRAVRCPGRPAAWPRRPGPRPGVRRETLAAAQGEGPGTAGGGLGIRARAAVVAPFFLREAVGGFGVRLRPWADGLTAISWVRWDRPLRGRSSSIRGRRGGMALPPGQAGGGIAPDRRERLPASDEGNPPSGRASMEARRKTARSASFNQSSQRTGGTAVVCCSIPQSWVCGGSPPAAEA
jgi:hypothetical protein